MVPAVIAGLRRPQHLAASDRRAAARWKLGPPWSTTRRALRHHNAHVRPWTPSRRSKLVNALAMRAAVRTAAAAAAAADIAAPCCSGAQIGCSARLEARLPSARLEGLRRGLGRACARVGVQVSALSELVRGRGLQRWGGEEPEDVNCRARPHHL